MDKKFEKFLKDFADHEEQKTAYIFKEPRNKILVCAGMHLNWMGDFFANPKIKWKLKEIDVEKIIFTGTGEPKWNDILLKECERSPEKFQKMLKEKPEIKRYFEKASFGDEPIIVRKANDKKGFFKTIDGMHRAVGAAISGKKKVMAWVPTNEEKHLPYCEAHTIYDLIRGYIRNRRTKEGQKELYYSLKLLKNTYGNVEKLLKERFNEKWVFEKDVQAVIKKVLRS